MRARFQNHQPGLPLRSLVFGKRSLETRRVGIANFGGHDLGSFLFENVLDVHT